jgi:hypothetical protein
MRLRLSLFALACYALMLTGCGSSGGAFNGPTPTPTVSPTASPSPTPTPTGNGRLRIVNASPDAPNLDILSDGTNFVPNLAFGSASSYITTTAGVHAINVNVANTTTNLMTTNIVVQNGDQTLFVVGRAATMQPVIHPDNNATPAAGNIRVRLIHAGSGVGNVDVFLTAPGDDISTGPPTASNIAFRGATGEVDIPAGEYRVRVTAVGTRSPVLIDTGTLNLASGKIYTTVIVGEPGAGLASALLVLTDN